MSAPDRPDPPDDDDLDLGALDDELEKWGADFDNLTGSSVGGAPGERKASESDALPEPAEVDALFDAGGDGPEFGEALGGMLGAEPAPLPEAAPEESLVTSAARPGEKRTSLRSLPAVPALEPLKGELPPAPTDDEIFGDAAQRDFGAAIAGDEFDAPPVTAGGRPSGTGPGTGEAGVDDDAAAELGGAEATRVGDVDAALLAAVDAGEALAPPARASSKPVPGATDITRRAASLPGLGDVTRRAPVPERRGPAVVRRDDLGEKDAAGDFDEPQSTRIADADAMGRLADEMDQHEDDLRFEPPTPGTPAAPLDDDDYDDIEIGTASDDSADEASAAPQPAPRAPDSAPVRRVSQNVVRRNTPPPGVPRIATPIPEKPPAVVVPEPPPPAPVLEMDAGEPEDVFPGQGPAATLGRPDTIASPTAEPAAGPPAEAAAAPDAESGWLTRDEEKIRRVAAELAELEVDAPTGVRPAPEPEFLTAQPVTAPAPVVERVPSIDPVADFAAALAELDDEPKTTPLLPEEPPPPVERARTPSRPPAERPRKPSTPPPPPRPKSASRPPPEVEPVVAAVAEPVAAAVAEPVAAAEPPPPVELPPPRPAPTLAVLDLTIDPTAFRFSEADDGATPARPADGPERLEILERELTTLAAEAAPPAPAVFLALRLAAGRAAEAAGDRARARDHYEEALLLDPASLVATRALRRVAIATGDLREAARHLETEAAAAGPGDAAAALRAYRADLLVAAGEQDLARVAHGELADARPDDVRALLAQLELAFADDRQDELPALCARAAAAVGAGDPGLAGALAALGARTLAAAGRAPEAAAAWGAALAHAGDDPHRRAASALGRLSTARAAGDAAAADAAALDLLGASATPDPALAAAVHRRRARALAAAGDPAGADAALAAALALAPEDPLLLAARAAVRPSDAAAAAAAASAEPDAARRAAAWRRTAAVARAAGDAAAAVAAWSAALGAEPGDRDAAAELEAALVAAGQADEAAALALARGEHRRGARLLLFAGQPGAALAALAAAPDPATTLEARAALLAAQGRWAERAALLAALADGDPLRPEPGAARHRAARAADLAAAAAPDDATLAEAAASAWARVLEVCPGDLSARLAAWRTAERRGEAVWWRAALAETQAAARDPSFVVDLAVRRDALAGAPAGDPDALEAAAAVDPYDARLALAQALADAEAGRWEELARRTVTVAQGWPEGPRKTALTSFAAAIFEEKTDALASAAELASPLVAAEPGYVGLHVLLERTLRRLGDPAALAAAKARALGLATAAASAAGAAAAATPGAAWRYAEALELAELYEIRLGDARAALGWYGQVLTWRPDDAVALAGFARACEAAGELRPLAERALAEVERASASGEVAARVAAYEELARVDGELRGDAASALLAWETVAEIDPTRLPALRALERAYVVEGRSAELTAVYTRQEAIADAGASGDVATLALRVARHEDAAGRQPEALAAARRAFAAQPHQRMALFHLEAHAHHLAQHADLAALDEAAAAYFTGDVRAHAVFLARAGEAWADAGQLDLASARYRAASDALPDLVPALRAWRRAAAAAGLWADVSLALEREAAATRDAAARVRLLHGAGVLALDKAGDADRALALFREVLAAQPMHVDALVRLRAIYEELGHWDDLVALLGARVEREPDRARQIELHGALARLHRDFRGDRDAAKTHFRAVVQRDPQHLPAVAALSDIAWEQGQWAEAADALIMRAKLEKQPPVLKEIFYRLGLIYAERLPEPRWALKSFERVLQIDPTDDSALAHVARLAEALGDQRMALGAAGRLVELAQDPAEKIGRLHLVARLAASDAKRAEAALKQALDVDATDPRAIEAIAAFYEQHKDLTSLRVQMDRVAGLMRMRLKKDAFDGVAFRTASRALTARARARVGGSLMAARAAAELAHALGAAEDPERRLAGEAQTAPPPAIAGLADLGIDETLFHPAVPSGVRHIFRLLHEPLAKRFAADLRRHGVGRADKLPKSGHPVKDQALAVAEQLGIAELDVYVSSAQPTALAVELTEPLTLILGSHLATVERPAQLRFAVGRALKLAASYMAVPARLTAEQLGALLAGVIRQYEPSFAPSGVPAGDVAEETQKLSRLISKRLRDEVYPFASEIAGAVFDPAALALGVTHTGNRAGLVASGSALGALVVLLRLGGHADLAAARGDAQIEELLRYAVSDEHAEVQRILGAG